MARKEGIITRSFTFEGKRYYVSAETEVEAEVKKAMKLRDLQEGKYTIGSNMTVQRWAEICMEAYKMPTLKFNTYEKYQNRMKNCVLKHIGHMQLKSVRPITCQNVMNAQQGNSAFQIAETRNMMNFLFKYAVKEKLILENPAEYVVKPEGTKTTRRSMTAEERKHFLACVDKDHRFVVFELMYHASCRPSEAREVRGKDIFLKDGYPVIHVRGTKTKKSDRIVPIPFEFYQKIKNTPPFETVAKNRYGVKLSPQAHANAWVKLRKEMNLSMGCRVHEGELIPPFPLAEDLVPYCLRHTFCTQLQKKGVDIRTAQYLMGHADIQMTANIYTHADDETILMAAELLCGNE